jgi:hypothetical protein
MLIDPDGRNAPAAHPAAAAGHGIGAANELSN